MNRAFMSVEHYGSPTDSCLRVSESCMPNSSLHADDIKVTRFLFVNGAQCTVRHHGKCGRHHFKLFYW